VVEELTHLFGRVKISRAIIGQPANLRAWTMTDLTQTIARRFVAGASTLPPLPLSLTDQSAKSAGVSFCTGTIAAARTAMNAPITWPTVE
jgi:hypothetical protein